MKKKSVDDLMSSKTRHLIISHTKVSIYLSATKLYSDLDGSISHILTLRSTGSS